MSRVFFEELGGRIRYLKKKGRPATLENIIDHYKKRYPRTPTIEKEVRERVRSLQRCGILVKKSNGEYDIRL